MIVLRWVSVTMIVVGVGIAAVGLFIAMNGQPEVSEL